VERSFLVDAMFSLPDSTWIGLVEFVECFAPPGDALSFDESGGLEGAFVALVLLGGAFAGPLVLDVDDGQPQQLDHGVVAGKCRVLW